MSFPSVAAQLLFQVFVIIFSSLSSFFASSPEECPQNESASLTPKGPAVDARNLRELGLRVLQVRQFRVGKTKKNIKKNRRTLITDTKVSFPTFSTFLSLYFSLSFSLVLYSRELAPCKISPDCRERKGERRKPSRLARTRSHRGPKWARCVAFGFVFFPPPPPSIPPRETKVGGKRKRTCRKKKRTPTEMSPARVSTRVTHKTGE